MSECDVISLHVPETPQTKYMIGTKELSGSASGIPIYNTFVSIVLTKAASIPSPAPVLEMG